MWRDPNLLVLLLYALVFVVTAFRRGQFQWLWGAVLLWLGFGLISATVMPSVLGLTHLANLYPLPAYIALAGLAVFLGKAWDGSPPNGRFALRGIGSFLPLLAVSGLVVLTAFLLLASMIVLLGQGEFLPLFAIGVLLDPLYWLAIQATLMLTAAAARQFCGEEPTLFSVRQCLFLLLLALLLLLMGKVLSLQQLLFLLYWWLS